MASTRPALRRVEKARAKAAKRARRRPLSVDAMIDVALRIVDTEGTEAVSMRRVAAEFDTGPASLYAHVRNRDELLRLVLDRILEEIEVPAPGPWEDVVRAWAENSRAVFVAHNDAAVLSFAHVPSGDRMLALTEALMGSMIDGGVPARVAAWALDTLSLYVAADAYEGWLYGRRFADASGRASEQNASGYFADLQSSFASLPTGRYPHVTAHVSELMAGDGDERFAFGLSMFIAGIAAQVRS